MTLDKCPYCGSSCGLYSIEYVSYPQYYDFNGEENGYGEFTRASTSARRKSTPVYCQNCEKRITTLEKLLEDLK